MQVRCQCTAATHTYNYDADGAVRICVYLSFGCLVSALLSYILTWLDVLAAGCSRGKHLLAWLQTSLDMAEPQRR
jgi:hypothetical protein